MAAFRHTTYSFENNSRSIDTQLENLTLNDIQKIINETKGIVLVASTVKMAVESVLNGVVTYKDSYVDAWGQRHELPVLNTGDVLTIIIDYGGRYEVENLSIEVNSGKQEIVDAINDMGGIATNDMSFHDLAIAIRSTLDGNNVTAKGMVADSLVYALQFFFEAGSYTNLNDITEINDDKVTSINRDSLFANCLNLQKVTMSSLTSINANNTFLNCTSLKELSLPNLTSIASNVRAPLHYYGTNPLSLPKLQTTGFSNNGEYFGIYAPNASGILLPSLTAFGQRTGITCPLATNIVLGRIETIGNYSGFGGNMPKLRNITIGYNTNINLSIFSKWTATDVIYEGQSGIDELNANIMVNIVPNLYQGGGKTITFGAALYNVLTQATKDAIIARGWNVAG